MVNVKITLISSTRFAFAVTVPVTAILHYIEMPLIDYKKD